MSKRLPYIPGYMINDDPYTRGKYYDKEGKKYEIDQKGNLYQIDSNGNPVGRGPNIYSYQGQHNNSY